MGNSPFCTGVGGALSGCVKSMFELGFMENTGVTLSSVLKVACVGDVSLWEGISMSSSGMCPSVLRTFRIGDGSVHIVFLFVPVCVISVFVGLVLATGVSCNKLIGVKYGLLCV